VHQDGWCTANAIDLLAWLTADCTLTEQSRAFSSITGREVFKHEAAQAAARLWSRRFCQQRLHAGQPYYFSRSVRPISGHLDVCLRSTNCHLLAVSPCAKPSFASRAFVYLHLISGIHSYISAHLTVLLLLNPGLNLNYLFYLYSPASASDSTCDYWRYILIIWLTLIHIDKIWRLLLSLKKDHTLFKSSQIS